MAANKDIKIKWNYKELGKLLHADKLKAPMLDTSKRYNADLSSDSDVRWVKGTGKKRAWTQRTGDAKRRQTYELYLKYGNKNQRQSAHIFFNIFGR